MCKFLTRGEAEVMYQESANTIPTYRVAVRSGAAGKRDLLPFVSALKARSV